METKTYTTLGYHELEKLAKDVFGIDYEYVAEEELGNDENQTYTINEKDLDNGWDWREWAEFLEGKERRWRAHMLITRLVSLGKIPAGNILVELSW
jgi:hypothetical protein